MIKVSKEIILSILKDRMAGIISLCLLIGLFFNAKAQSSQDSIMLEGRWVKIHKKNFETTVRDAAYGPYERNKLDFWKAESKTPTPLVLYIHGGGWGAGSKEENSGPYLNLLKEGVSYVSINYRLARGANKLPCSLIDAARALQFVRSKAAEWNIDPDRIIATGGSAGGCSSLWLACHDDLANPKSEDPIERESTRLLAAAVISAQTTIDAMLIQNRIGTSATSHGMIWKSVGATSQEDLLANWENYKDLALECSPLTHLSKDDPPVYLTYSDDSPKPITRNGIHHAEFGRILKGAADSIGVDCTFEIQSAETRQTELEKFMLRTFNESIELYIASNGNDEWTGRLSKPNSDKSDGPLATLNAARVKVREYISGGLPGPMTVWIRGGEYVLDSTIIFGPEDSGTKEFPVYYRAYPEETPVIIGGKKLHNWGKCTVDPPGISDKTKGNLWYYEIPEDKKGVWQITTLYDGKKLLTRSRSEKFKASEKQVLDLYNAQPKDVRGVDWDAEPLVFRREFRYNGDDLKAWATPSDIEIFLSPKHGWLINMLPLERIDTKSKTAFFAVDPTYGIRPGNDYYVENAIEYLDEPGEWIFDSMEGRIYIWPETSLDKADIRAPFLQEFIRVEGIEDSIPVQFLHFEGLTFRHGLRDTWKPGDKGLQHDWEMYDKGNAVIRFRHAEDCSVTKCTFEASSGSGVRLDLHAQRNKVADCVFAHLGGTGILLSGYGPGLKDENKFNTVTNNYIHHVGTIYKHSPGIFIAQSGHNLISHNTIHDLAYNGMIISGCRPHELVLAKPLQNRREWVSSIRLDEIGPLIKHITPEMLRNWLEFDVSKIETLLHSRENLIEYNEIYRVMLELYDGNGIYFSAMGKNNRAVRNYLHDIYNSNGYIRLDDVSGYTIITHNVGVRGSRMMQIKGPGEIRNNFAIDTELIIARRWCPTEIDNFILYNTPQGKGHFNQYERFPDVKMIYEFFDRVSNSLIFVEDPPNEIKLGQDVIAPNRRGVADVGMLFADPLFDEQAMKQRIFRFKPGSPAPGLGIEPIDLSSAGSTLAKNKFTAK